MSIVHCPNGLKYQVFYTYIYIQNFWESSSEMSDTPIFSSSDKISPRMLLSLWKKVLQLQEP